MYSTNFQFICISVNLSKRPPWCSMFPIWCRSLESSNLMPSLSFLTPSAPSVVHQTSSCLFSSVYLRDIPQAPCNPRGKIVRGLNQVTKVVVPPLHLSVSLDIIVQVLRKTLPEYAGALHILQTK
jgi:hypothetical protein